MQNNITYNGQATSSELSMVMDVEVAVSEYLLQRALQSVENPTGRILYKVLVKREDLDRIRSKRTTPGQVA